MSSIYNKKLWAFLLSASLLMPTAAQARGRDIAMAVSGAIIVGAGVTFIIKSGKTKPQEPKLTFKPWAPISTDVKYDPIRR